MLGYLELETWVERWGKSSKDTLILSWVAAFRNFDTLQHSRVNGLFRRPELPAESRTYGLSLLQQLAAFRTTIWTQGVFHRFSITATQGNMLAKVREKAIGKGNTSTRLAALSFFARLWPVVSPSYGKQSSPVLSVRDVLNLWGNMMTDSSDNPRRLLRDIGLVNQDGSHASVHWGKHLLLQYLADVLGNVEMVKSCARILQPNTSGTLGVLSTVRALQWLYWVEIGGNDLHSVSFEEEVACSQLEASSSGRTQMSSMSKIKKLSWVAGSTTVFGRCRRLMNQWYAWVRNYTTVQEQLDPGDPFHGAAWCDAVSLGVSTIRNAGYSHSPIASPDMPEPYCVYLFLRHQQGIHPFWTGTSEHPPLLAPWHVSYPMLAGFWGELAALYGDMSQFRRLWT